MSDPARPTPFRAVFGTDGAERFGPLRSGLAAAGADPLDRDAFVLVREVAELLHELREGGEDSNALPALVAFLQHAYLFWAAGEPVTPVSEARLARALSGSPAAASPQGPPSSGYVQLPPLRVWGTPLPGAAEPLDGWFAGPRGAELWMLAIFGMTPARSGFTAVEVSGARRPQLSRADGTPLFAPTLPGGASAGLASLVGEEELLELAWRIAADEH